MKIDLENLPVAIRSAMPEDLNFIFNSWLVSYRNGKPTHNIDNPFYYAGQHKLMERIIRQSKILLAVDAENTEDIYGYLIWEEIDGVFVMHYAYVKQTFRRLGLIHKLLKEAGRNSELTGIYTHDSKCAKFVGQRLNLYYNPYVLFECLKPLDAKK